jgi:menaquinone-specific isochorismate synthase
VSEPSSTASSRSPESAPLVVRTVAIDDPGPLLALLPDTPDAAAWVRRGDGVVGWGAAAICRTTGADRFADAKQWWSEHVRTAVVRDEVDRPGTGMVCFGSFAFADAPGDSVLVVPEVVVGRRGDATWLTTIGVGAIPSFPVVTATDARAASRSRTAP